MAFTMAVATDDGVTVDLPFGSTTRWLIVRVGDDGSLTQEGWRDVPAKDSADARCEPWLEGVAERLEGADYALTTHIGPKPHRYLLARGTSGLEYEGAMAEAVPAIERYRARAHLDERRAW